MSTRTRRLLILFLLMAIGAGALAGAYAVRKTMRKAQAAEALEAGLEHYAQERWPEAVQNLSRAASHPVGRNDAEVMYAFADARRHVPMENFRHLPNARIYAQAAHELAPEDPRPLRLLSSLYAVMGYPRERLEVSDRMLAIAPDDRESHQAKFESLIALNHDQEALEAAKIMVELFPYDVSVHRNLLVAMARTEADPSEVLAYASDLSEANPESAEFAVLHLQSAFATGDQELVASIAQTLPDLLVTNPESLRGLATTLDTKIAPRYITNLIDAYAGVDGFEPHVTVLRAERAWKGLRSTEATEILEPVLVDRSAAPARALALDVLIKRYTLNRGQWEDSLTELNSRDGDEAQSWRIVLEMYDLMNRNEAQAALDAERRTLEIDLATDEYLALARAQCYQILGNRDSAIASLEDAVLREPRWMWARLNLVDLQREASRHAEALRQASMNRAQFPNDVRAAMSFLQATVDATVNGDASSDDHVAGIAELDRIEGDESTDDDRRVALYLIRARLMAALNRPGDAREALAKLFDLEATPGSSEYAQLIQLVDRLELDEFRPALETMGEDVEESPAVLFARARTAADQGRRDEGESLLRDAMTAAEGPQQMAYKRALARFLEYIDDEESLALQLELARDFPDIMELQEEVLRLERAWTDEANITGPLGRIRDALTENSTLWKLYDARRVLTFEPTDQSRAKAAANLEDLIARDPTNSEAHALLAEAYVQLDDISRAADSLARAVDLNRERAALYPALIRLYQAAGRVEDAVRRLEDFVALGDVNDRLRRERARYLQRQGMWADAEADLRILAVSGQSEDQVNLARFLIDRGRADEADDMLELMLASDPGPGEIELAARFYVKQDRLDHALALLGRLEEIDEENRPSQMRIDQLAASLCEGAGDIAEAERRFSQVAASTQDPSAWAELAIFYVRQNDLEKARGALESGRNTGQTSNRLAEAEGIIDPTSTSTAAARHVNDLIRAQSMKPAEGEDPSEYLAALRNVTATHRTFIEGWQRRIEALLTYGRADEAIDVARSAVRFNPANAFAARLLALALANSGQTSEALIATSQWRELMGSLTYDADILSARLHEELDQLDEAYRALAPHDERLRREGGSSLRTYASSIAATARSTEMRSLLDDPALSAENRTTVYLASAQGLLNTRPAEARALLESPPADSNLDEPRFQASLAALWFEVGQRLTATDAVERAVELLDSIKNEEGVEPGVLAILGQACEWLGRDEQAERAYREFLAIVPDHPLVLNNLAFLLVRTERSSSEALDLARQAADAASEYGLDDTQRASFLDTLAAAQIATGDPAGAEVSCRAGLDLGPDNAELIVRLAKAVYAQRGDRDVDQDLRELFRRFDGVQTRQRVAPALIDEMTRIRTDFESQSDS